MSHSYSFFLHQLNLHIWIGKDLLKNIVTLNLKQYKAQTQIIKKMMLKRLWYDVYSPIDNMAVSLENNLDVLSWVLQFVTPGKPEFTLLLSCFYQVFSRMCKPRPRLGSLASFLHVYSCASIRTLMSADVTVIVWGHQSLHIHKLSSCIVDR